MLELLYQIWFSDEARCSSMSGRARQRAECSSWSRCSAILCNISSLGLVASRKVSARRRGRRKEVDGRQRVVPALADADAIAVVAVAIAVVVAVAAAIAAVAPVPPVREVDEGGEVRLPLPLPGAGGALVSGAALSGIGLLRVAHASNVVYVVPPTGSCSYIVHPCSLPLSLTLPPPTARTSW